MRKLLWILAAIVGAVGILRVLGCDTTIGGYTLNQPALAQLHKRGYRRSRIVIGGCVINRDIDARMLTEVIPSLIVCGGLVGPTAMSDAYGTKLISIGGATFTGPSHPASRVI